MDNDTVRYLEIQSLSCSDVEKLIDSYVDGEMAEALVHRFESHLSECPLCRGLVGDIQTIVGLAKQLNSHPVPFSVHERLRNRLNEELGTQIPKRTKPYLIK